MTPARADVAPLPGTPVPGQYLSIIQQAAKVCPDLTPARLAAQLMQESRFDPNAVSSIGAQGIAQFLPGTWPSYAPWPGASPFDPQAAITAQAKFMCELFGQLRANGPAGDPWQLALAAYVSGMGAVQQAGGIPNAEEPRNYVDKVLRYEAWYAQDPQLGNGQQLGSTGISPGPHRTSATASPMTSGPASSGGTSYRGPSATPVPTILVATIRAAGAICPALTPARIAGQLMAESGFVANKLGAGGARGMAQFLPEMWARYAPSPANVWDPAAAIPALARAMCDLVQQMSALGGNTDPYPLALAAYRWGTNAVKLAGRVPDATALRQYIDQVLAYAQQYARDTRLGSNGSPAPSRAPGPSVSVGLAGPSGTTAPAPAATAAIPVPDALVALIVSAGRQCGDGRRPDWPHSCRSNRSSTPRPSAVTASGIAMFTPATWSVYRPTANASPMDPAAAIPAAARYMCDLLDLVRSARLPGDAYANGLVAYHWGMANLTEAGSVPAGSDAECYLLAVQHQISAYGTTRD